MPAQLLPTGRQDYFDANGNPLVGGQLFTYDAGTNNPRLTWADALQATPNANPIVLDARGECTVFWSGAYKIVLKDSLGNTIWTVDNASTVLTNVTQSLIPASDNLYDLGSNTFSWRQLYLGANHTPALDTTTGNIGYIARTAAEIAAGVIPTNFWAQPYTLLRYGADTSGAADATVALQNALNCAAQANRAMVYVGIPGATLKIGNAWTIDTNKTGIDFQGAYINASGFVTGNWCSPTQSAADVNQRPGLNNVHPIMRAYIQGPGKQNVNAICFYLNDTAGTPTIAGLMFKDLGIFDWGQWFYFNNGAFCNTCINCSFGPTVAGSSAAMTTYGITQANATNTGERNSFLQCAFYNSEKIAQCLSGSAEIHFVECSADYFTRAFNVQGGTIRWNGGHIESNTDTDNWGFVTGANSTLVIRGSQINVTGSKATFDMFWSDATTTNGGVFLDDCFLAIGGVLTVTTKLIGSTGNFRVRNLMQYANGDRPTIGAFCNLLAYGGFESANYSGEWVLTNGAIRSGTQFHSGAFSLSCPSINSSNATAVGTFVAKPGQYVQGELWYIFPGVASGTIFGQLDFLDKGGNSLASSAFLAVAVAVNVWTKSRFKIVGPAPAGTVNLRLNLQVFGVSAGTQTGYFDDIILNLTE